MKPAYLTFLLLIAALGLGALAGYADMTNEEVQWPALIILVSAFALSLFAPRFWWLWALVIGLSIPAAHLVGAALNIQPPYPTDWLSLTLLPLAFAFVAALVAFLARRQLDRAGILKTTV